MSTTRQRTPQVTPTSEHVELDIAFEDTGGLSSAEYQKPAPSLPTPQTVATSQSLAAAVDALVDVVGQNESQLLASLEPNDYQKFIQALETLTAIVGEDDSIAALIKKIESVIEDSGEEEFRMNVQNYPEEVRLPAPPQRVNLAALLAQEADLNESDETLNLASSNLDLLKEVRLPAPPQRVNLAALLAQETDDSTSGEIDTGPPVGNEIC